MSALIDKVLSIEAAEIGYVEGYQNLTKYARELDAVEVPRIGREGSAWCGTFQDWAFWKAGALGALVMRNFATVPAARAYMAKGLWFATPVRGDLAFLHNTGWDGHVGLVESVNLDGTVVTLEGNTSGGNVGSQNDGGHAARRVRAQSFWVGYARPNYTSVVPDAELLGIGQLIAVVKQSTVQLGSQGIAVSVLQNALHIATDSDFGPITETAVKAFQTWYSGAQYGRGVRDPYLLVPGYPDPTKPANGVVDPHTWAALLGDGGEK